MGVEGRVVLAVSDALTHSEEPSRELREILDRGIYRRVRVEVGTKYCNSGVVNESIGRSLNGTGRCRGVKSETTRRRTLWDRTYKQST